MKKIIPLIFTLLCFTTPAMSQSGLEPMDFDLSEKMLFPKKKEAKFEVSLSKGDKNVYENIISIDNGVAYPLIQHSNEINIEDFNLIKDKDNYIGKELEEEEVSFILQMIWHTDGDESNWVQFNTETLNKKYVVKELLEEDKKAKGNLKPYLNKKNDKITIPVTKNYLATFMFGEYIFKVKKIK